MLKLEKVPSSGGGILVELQYQVDWRLQWLRLTAYRHHDSLWYTNASGFGNYCGVFKPPILKNANYFDFYFFFNFSPSQSACRGRTTLLCKNIFPPQSTLSKTNTFIWKWGFWHLLNLTMRFVWPQSAIKIRDPPIFKENT